MASSLVTYSFLGFLDRAGSRMVAFGDRVFFILKVGRGINPPIASDGHGDMRSKYGVQGQREEWHSMISITGFYFSRIALFRGRELTCIVDWSY